MKSTYILSLLLLIVSVANGQNSLASYHESIQQYEPSTDNPYGQLNPNAPDELKQFDFMVGVCHCTDSILNKDGSYRVYPSIWRGKYFLNGQAIQDNNFNPVNPTSNLRLYDKNTGLWKVTYLQSATGYFTGVWQGGLNEAGDMVLTDDLNTGKSILTFYDITDKGYKWKSETVGSDGSVIIGWRKTCIKQN